MGFPAISHLFNECFDFFRRLHKWKFFKRSFVSVYKSPQMQTMDDKAELVQKLLSWLFGEITLEREWQNTSNDNLLEVQEYYSYFIS